MNKEYSDWIKAMGVGFEIAISVLGGGFLGYKIGEYFGISPVGLLIGLFLGIVSGFYGVYKIFG